MSWSQPVSKDRESSAPSDTELDGARGLVARILEFVASDPDRIGRFLRGTGFKLEAAHEMAQSPLFMLSALDTVVKDAELLRALQEHEQISPAFIELTQANLVFHIIAGLDRQGNDEARAGTERKRVRL